MQSLTTLNLVRNRIEILGVQYLADALQQNTVILFFIHLYCVYLNDVLQTLTMLNLESNTTAHKKAYRPEDVRTLKTVRLGFYKCFSYTCESLDIDVRQFEFSIH